MKCFKVTLSTGAEVTIKGGKALSEFGKHHNISIRLLVGLANGTRTSTNGLRCEKIVNDSIGQHHIQLQRTLFSCQQSSHIYHIGVRVF